VRLTPEFALPSAIQTGTLTSSSPTVTGLTSTAAIAGALGVSGTGIPHGTFVASIDSATQVTLTQAATATGVQSLTFLLEPITLAEAKLQLRLQITDDDGLVAAAIRAARIVVENHLRRALLTQTRILYLDSFPSAGGYYNRAIREIWPSLGGMPSGIGFYPGLIPNSTGVIDIPLPPLQSITSVQYYDFSGTLQTVPSSSYNASLGLPGRIQPQYSHVWPISRPTIDSVAITFVAGYGDTSDALPEPVRSAVKLVMSDLYEQRGHLSEVNVYKIPDLLDLVLASADPGIYY
jgi:hypothetical protein